MNTRFPALFHCTKLAIGCDTGGNSSPNAFNRSAEESLCAAANFVEASSREVAAPAINRRLAGFISIASVIIVLTIEFLAPREWLAAWTVAGTGCNIMEKLYRALWADSPKRPGSGERYVHRGAQG
jgi:hypothetical protein